MSERKNLTLLLGFVLSATLIGTALTAWLTADFYQKLQFDMLGTVCREIIEKHPEAEQTVSAFLKEHRNSLPSETGANILSSLGYHSSDFGRALYKQNMVFAVVGFMAGVVLLIITFWYRHKKLTLRLQEMTDYLEQVNSGSAGLTFPSGEDEFSKLQDEIYKTVTMLRQMHDTALETKNNFAENLSNIAHQLKTPITAISLSAQMLKMERCGDYPEQIRKQLSRLTRLEEALLVLSRIDAGTLSFERKPVDVFTVLTLAADNLQELFIHSGVSVSIPELGEVEVAADLEWTMEAFINLFKNAMEYTPPGKAVNCSYGKNPLYTEIVIWDEGSGFAKEDIPHLFERFYRGHNAAEGGIGIGLALAKEIIERQNGTIRAKNIPGRGACFEIRFYSH